MIAGPDASCNATAEGMRQQQLRFLAAAGAITCLEGGKMREKNKKQTSNDSQSTNRNFRRKKSEIDLKRRAIDAHTHFSFSFFF